MYETLRILNIYIIPDLSQLIFDFAFDILDPYCSGFYEGIILPPTLFQCKMIALYNYRSIINKLIKHKVFNYEYGFYGAAQSGNIELAKFSLQYISFPEHVVDNSLFNVCKNGHYDMLIYLITKYNIKPIDIRCLNIACEKGHINIVKFLVENGMNDKNSLNCGLWYSCVTNNIEIYDYLIKKGATRKLMLR